LSEREREYRNLLAEKQHELDQLTQEIHEIRLARGDDSGGGSSGHSPDGKKKKSSTLSLFR
jgi:hypothetical protein